MIAPAWGCTNLPVGRATCTRWNKQACLFDGIPPLFDEQSRLFDGTQGLFNAQRLLFNGTRTLFVAIEY